MVIRFLTCAPYSREKRAREGFLLYFFSAIYYPGLSVSLDAPRRGPAPSMARGSPFVSLKISRPRGPFFAPFFRFLGPLAGVYGRRLVAPPRGRLP